MKYEMEKLEKRRPTDCFPLQYRRSGLSSLMILSLVVALHSVLSLSGPFDEKAAPSTTFDEKQLSGEAAADGKTVELNDGPNPSLMAERLVNRTLLKRWNRSSGKRYPRSGSSDCGFSDFKPKVNSRIVGGVEATPHSWPWQVSVMVPFLDAWHHLCGGVVLSPTWIVSAAHCFYDLISFVKFRVRLGAHDRVHQGNNEQVFDVKEVVVHADYNQKTHDNDIALIRLATKAQFNSFVKPICLPEVDAEVDILSCVVSGWGSTMGMAQGNETALQQVYVPVIGRSQCNQPDWYNGRVTDNMLCAGFPEGGKDACQGDSGGPFVCRLENRWKLFGVTSFGDGCAMERRPGVYTRVTKYLQWIKEKAVE